MAFGYYGKVLRIDLSEDKIEIETPDISFYRTYLGGRAIGLYYLLKETPPCVDAYAPNNLLIFAPSVLTGTPFPGNARFSVVTKSPQTGGMGEAEAGGPWGPELKWSGWDAIVIRGCADRPVYVSIHDDDVKIHSAHHLWGLDTLEALDAVVDEIGEPKARAVTIGPAGENLVRYAAITAGYHDMPGH